MSHESGKIEVMGMTEDQIFFKYARAASEDDNGRFLAFYRNPAAGWFDDYKKANEEFSLFKHNETSGVIS